MDIDERLKEISSENIVEDVESWKTKEDLIKNAGVIKTKDFIIQDSGQRTNFDTGAVRDIQEGKGIPSLMPPEVLFRISKHYENGLKKYGPRNWEKGIPVSSHMDSIFRHWGKYLGGYKDEDHLAAIAWNVMCIMHYEIFNTNMIDIPRVLDEWDYSKGPKEK